MHCKFVTTHLVMMVDERGGYNVRLVEIYIHTRMETDGEWLMMSNDRLHKVTVVFRSPQRDEVELSGIKVHTFAIHWLFMMYSNIQVTNELINHIYLCVYRYIGVYNCEHMGSFIKSTLTWNYMLDYPVTLFINIQYRFQ